MIAKPAFPRTIGEQVQLRIDQGEPWLRVWSQQLAIPLAIIERKTRFGMVRLVAIESVKAKATDAEMESLATALNTGTHLQLTSCSVKHFCSA